MSQHHLSSEGALRTACPPAAKRGRTYLSAVQDKIRTISKAVQITIGSIVHYLRTAGGKSINVLMQVHGGDAFAVVNAIKRDGIPRRLVNYADFLPHILDGSEMLT